ncbi:MAG: hypothetical protein JXA30_13215 [Deltaproteobacteria bacterium]|nr:hypothetical protein [Deltaproteobacteria bacterium]
MISLNITHNTGRLPSDLSTCYRSGKVARGWIGITIVLAVALSSSYGCEDFDAPKKDSEAVSSRDDSGTGSSASSGSKSDAGEKTEMDASTEDAESPPEDKKAQSLKRDFVVAQSTEDFIFIPNPENHCVTVIDGESLIKGEADATKCLSCVKGQCVGIRPTYMAVYTKRTSIAIVIDKGTRNAAVIQKSPAAETIDQIEVTKGANAIRFAPGGSHAVAYYDPQYVGDADEVGSYQEITVISLENIGEKDKKIASNMVVGLRPRELFFKSNGEQAFFVTDDGISIVDFTAIDNEKNSSIADTFDYKGHLDPAEAKITVFGGRFFAGYKPGSDELFLLDIYNAQQRLETLESVYSLKMDGFFRKGSEDDGNGGSGGNGSNGDEDDAGRKTPDYDVDKDEIDPRTELPKDVVPGIADVAMNPSESSGFAMVTIPDPGLVIKIDIPNAFTTSDVLDEVEFYLVNEKYERVVVSSDGEKALAFNQADKSLRAVLLDLTGDSPPAVTEEEWVDWAFTHIKYINLSYPISRAEAINTAKAMVAFHEPASTLRSIAKGYGYTIINLDKKVGRFKETPSPITSYVTYRNAFFAQADNDEILNHQVYRTGLQDLLSSSIELKAKPNAIGVMAGDKVESIFISHEHPDGHIILINDEGKPVTKPFVGFQIINRVQEF